MGDPAAPPLDLARIVRGLAAHDVDYVLVGGSAAAAGYGAERVTTDIDICVRWDRNNLTRAASALRELGAELRVEGLDEPFPVPQLDQAMLANMELSAWRTDAGDVDILRGIPVRGLKDLAFHDELAGRAQSVTLFGVQVSVAALEDIIASKEGVDRPSDREALPELRALRTAIASGRADLEDHDRRPPPLDAAQVVADTSRAAFGPNPAATPPGEARHPSEHEPPTAETGFELG